LLRRERSEVGECSLNCATFGGSVVVLPDLQGRTGRNAFLTRVLRAAPRSREHPPTEGGLVAFERRQGRCDVAPRHGGELLGTIRDVRAQGAQNLGMELSEEPLD